MSRSTLDHVRNVLVGAHGPAVCALVAAELADTEYGDLDQAAEELIGALDLLDLEVTPPYSPAGWAHEVLGARRFLEARSAEVSPTELARAALVDEELAALLDHVHRRHL